jgi:hypothetical protein
VRCARALSVVLLSLAVGGCLAKTVVEPPSRPAPRPSVVTPGRSGFVVAAADSQAAELAADVARRTGFALVVAGGDARDGGYDKRVQDAAQGRLQFYAELRGQGDTRGRVEIATVGVDREFSQRLRSLFELIRDAHLRTRPSTPKLEVVVEPASRAFDVAASGRPSATTRMLQLELPRAARESYAPIVADFLLQAATLPVGR